MSDLYSMMGFSKPGLVLIDLGATISTENRSTYIHLFSGIDLIDTLDPWTEEPDSDDTWTIL